ncbi:hypothetical protein GEMRC1_010766 [Eukaryota sp. GEM-RC1]
MTTTTSTVTCSLAKFFDPPARAVMNRQFRYLRDVAVHSTLLARVFVLQHPHLARWLTDQRFWYQCFGFVAHSEPKVNRPFENDNGVYTALHLSSSLPPVSIWPFPPLGRHKPTRWCYSQLLSDRSRQLSEAFQQLMADGPVSWKLNFFRTAAVFLDCPTPKGYASAVVRGAQPGASLQQWWNAHHQQTLATFNHLVGDVVLFNNLLTERSVALNETNTSFLFAAGLNLLSALEDAAPDCMRRHALVPMASYAPVFVSFSQEVEKHFTEFNFSRTLKSNPLKTFRKRPRFQTYTLASDGPKKTRNRPTKEQFESRRASGSEDFKVKSRKRKCNLQKKVAPSRRRARTADFEPPPDEDWLWCAIDPNHSNLCGWSIGTNTDYLLDSGITLAPKAKAINTVMFGALSNSTSNTYSAQNMYLYLLEISTTIVDQNMSKNSLERRLLNGNRPNLRRNKFDFFIRKQKRFDLFAQNLKNMAQGSQIRVWFGTGGASPSRQQVKSPRKGFLQYLKRFFPVIMGDEYFTSAKTNCCKVRHQLIYHEIDGVRRVNHAIFRCPTCAQVWSRDISASRNQLEIAIEGYLFGTRPEAFQRT